MFEDVWLLVNSYLFQDEEKETGAELISLLPWPRADSSGEPDSRSALGSAASYWPE